MTKDIVIAGYKRTPFHFANKGALAKIRPDDLATAAVKALLEQTGVKGDDIEDLILGCAFPEGEQGFNIGKIVAQMAGLPITVAGVTVNRFCGSAMQAIHMAAGAIKMGAGDAFICGGVESMTRIPMGGFNPMPHPEFYKTYPAAYMSMGETAENSMCHGLIKKNLRLHHTTKRPKRLRLVILKMRLLQLAMSTVTALFALIQVLRRWLI